MSAERATLPGLGPRIPSLRFGFEDETVIAAEGETVASALLAAGHWHFRTDRAGDARGPYCGMGNCHECLVRVDGESRRACLVPVTAGMAVARHAPRQLAAAATAPTGGPPPLVCDVAVVGAGPAGLAAAIAAAEAGLAVVLVDERSQPGGQYFKQPAKGFALDPARLDAQFKAGRALAARAAQAGVKLLSGHAVWGTTGANDLLLDGAEGARRLTWKRLVLATGAVERAVPFPGWTLPGAMTTGAAQSFLRGQGLVAGQRVVVAGNGPLNLQLADEMTRAGAQVLVLAEAAAAPGLAALGHLARMARHAPDLVRDGLRYRAAVQRAGTRVLHRHAVLAAEGDGRVQAVRVAPIDATGRADLARAETIAADLLCVGQGFTPATELSAAMGCALEWDARWRHFRVVQDDEGRSSVPEIFVAGDGARFGGARLALATGRRAGLAASRDMGASVPVEPDTTRGHRAFQDALWTVYAAPVPGTERATPETMICRCEEVRLADITAALATGITQLGALKRATRLGMGRCQGRTCAVLALGLLERKAGAPPDAFDLFAPRAPFRPLPVAAIAALDLGDAA